jgi:exodeoxyribonuclease VII small subunit
LTFEESMKKLEDMSQKIKNEDTTLEEAIKYYEEGIKCYEACNKILNEAQAKIQIYRQETEE